MRDPLRVQLSGPLSVFAACFLEELLGRGYRPGDRSRAVAADGAGSRGPRVAQSARLSWRLALRRRASNEVPCERSRAAARASTRSSRRRRWARTSAGSSAQIDPMTLARMKTMSAQAMIHAVARMMSRGARGSIGSSSADCCGIGTGRCGEPNTRLDVPQTSFSVMDRRACDMRAPRVSVIEVDGGYVRVELDRRASLLVRPPP
jgi:hypothetical protein